MEKTQVDNNIYNQYWFYINTPSYTIYPLSNGCKNGDNSKVMTKRMVGISTPKNIDSNKKYKYILNNDFNIDGKASDWWCGGNDFLGKSLGGIISDASCINDPNYLLKNTMDLFIQFILNDYIIIHLSLTYEDVYYNQPCDSNIPCKKCWIKDNPDQLYLQNLFDI